MAHEDKQDDRAKLYKMIEKVTIAMLTTVEADGSLHTRPMANQESDANGDFWFYAEKGSAVEANVKANPSLALGFSDPSGNNYVAVSGRGELLYDRATIETHWNPSLKAWFPEGQDDPKIVVLRVVPARGEYWDTAQSVLLHAFGIVKTALGGGPPNELTDQAKVQL